MSHSVLVTVETPFCPTVVFEHREFKFLGKSPEDQVRSVLTAWSEITGLRWDVTPRTVTDMDGVRYVTATSPLVNRSDIRVRWSL